MPRVSVIVPLYNKGDFVRRTIDSVLAQTVSDWEIVVVDDGSIDDGPATVERYGDPRIRLIRQENAGPGAARNRAIREAYGEWIAPLDADDSFDPEWMATMLGWADEAPDCDAIVCYWYTNPTDREQVRRRYRDAGVPEGAYRLEPDIDVVTMFRLMTRFGARNTMLRRSFVLEKTTGFYEPKGIYGEDHYLWAQVLLGTKVYLGAEVLAFWDHGAAEISFWRKRGAPPPVRAVVIDGDEVRARAGPRYSALIGSWITELAKRETWQHLRAGFPDSARRYIALHPGIVRGLLERFRFWCWVRMASWNRERPARNWSWPFGWIFRRLTWLRPRVVHTWPS